MQKELSTKNEILLALANTYNLGRWRTPYWNAKIGASCRIPQKEEKCFGWTLSLVIDWSSLRLFDHQQQCKLINQSNHYGKLPPWTTWWGKLKKCKHNMYWILHFMYCFINQVESLSQLVRITYLHFSVVNVHQNEIECCIIYYNKTIISARLKMLI